MAGSPGASALIAEPPLKLTGTDDTPSIVVRSTDVFVLFLLRL